MLILLDLTDFNCMDKNSSSKYLLLCSTDRIFFTRVWNDMPLSNMRTQFAFLSELACIFAASVLSEKGSYCKEKKAK